MMCSVLRRPPHEGAWHASLSKEITMRFINGHPLLNNSTREARRRRLLVHGNHRPGSALHSLTDPLELTGYGDGLLLILIELRCFWALFIDAF